MKKIYRTENFLANVLKVLYVEIVRQIFKFFVGQSCVTACDYSLLLSVLIICRIPSPWSEADSEGETGWLPLSFSVLQMRQPDPEMTKTL